MKVNLKWINDAEMLLTVSRSGVITIPEREDETQFKDMAKLYQALMDIQEVLVAESLKEIDVEKE